MEQKDVARYVAVSILSILLTALLICQHNINVRQEKLEEYLYNQPIVSDTIEYEEEEPIEPIVTLETESMSSNVVNAIVEPEIEEPDIEDVDLLAHVINGEAGAEWCDEEMRYYVGSVVLNRVAHEEFPNTLEDVIYQEGQYGCVTDGHFDLIPSESSYNVAYDLLVNGSKLPENVVYQSNAKLGHGVYCKVQNMYFCYK